ncbi:hypothetical protein [Leptospira sp. 'Mane']|uniref:hypothetical protein n=1 Tax=Leptospira sp. 'Mane' TaxID=3387407 RepID=UPI00398A778C
MNTIPFTNTTGDGQISDANPDANRDYFLVSDYNNDKNYWHAKICEAIKFMSGNPNENFQILYGGLITNAGTSKINISEGAAIGKDTEGNYRVITIPALSNIPLPNDWNDDRQIWVIGQYDTKLNSAERQHFNGTAYYYQTLDSYLGEENTDDLFVESDPLNTAVKWGSFKMNGTAFTNQNDRSMDLATKFLALRDTPSSYSGKSGYLVGVKSDTSGLEFVKSGQIPIGTPFPFDNTFPNVPSLGSNFAPCDGSIITDADSLLKDYRTRNLNGATLSTLSVSNVNNTNKSVDLSSYDITALNVGDTVVGTGASLPSDCVISSISGNTIVFGKLSSIWNGTTYATITENITGLTSITVTGTVRTIEGGDSGGSFWDTLFNHYHLGYMNGVTGYTVGSTFNDYLSYGGNPTVTTVLQPVAASPENITPRLSTSTKIKTRRMKFYIRTS